jgi:hypothetical protein
VSRAAQISEPGVAVLPNCFRVNLFLAQLIRRLLGNIGIGIRDRLTRAAAAGKR